MKLQFDEPLSNMVFNFNLRHYRKEEAQAARDQASADRVAALEKATTEKAGLSTDNHTIRFARFKPSKPTVTGRSRCEQFRPMLDYTE